MSEIIGNIVDIDTSRAALAILETCVRRMRLWEAPYDLDERFVKDIDILLRHADLDDDIDNKIYILARCIQIVTDIIDRRENGEED